MYIYIWAFEQDRKINALSIEILLSIGHLITTEAKAFIALQYRIKTLKQFNNEQFMFSVKLMPRIR